MKILLVVAHGRKDALTKQAAAAFAESAKSAGHDIEVADLVEEKFDPVLLASDEPDWNDADKVYSDQVVREMKRVEQNQATVIFFPVWWWSMPAILKGWIDRVWNHGWAYGGKTYPHQKVLLVAIAGNGRENYTKRGYDTAMKTQLVTGILEYCGVKQGELHILYGTLEDADAPAGVVSTARDMGSTFSD
jgi:NAD(P)H dehydrogenase (quinone)